MNKRENIIFNIAFICMLVFTMISLMARIVFVIVFLDQVVPETFSLMTSGEVYEEVDGRIENYKENIHNLGRGGSYLTYDYDIVWITENGKEEIANRRRMDYKPNLNQTIFYKNDKTVVEHSKSWYKNHLFLVLRTEFVIFIIAVISILIRYIADKVIDRI